MLITCNVARRCLIVAKVPVIDGTKPLFNGACLAFHGRISVNTCHQQHNFAPTPSKDEKPKSSSVPVRSNSDINTYLQEKFKWAFDSYEKFTGVKDIRQIQDEVLRAERWFLETRREKKLSQDRVDSLKEEIKELWDKLESTPRSSDRYIELRTKEHNLVRQQALQEDSLNRLKDAEQATLDELSSLLRRSHEHERLRQDKSKFINLISMSIGLLGLILSRFIYKETSMDSMAETIKDLNSSKVSSLLDDLYKLEEKSQVILKEIQTGGQSVNNRLVSLESEIKTTRPVIERFEQLFVERLNSLESQVDIKPILEKNERSTSKRLANIEKRLNIKPILDTTDDNLGRTMALGVGSAIAFYCVIRFCFS